MEYSYIGVGSNQGDSIELIKKALKLINEATGVRIIRAAPLYRTEPIGFEDQPWFYNTVVELEVDITPFQLLELLQEVEKKLGRIRTLRWGPRTIDLDILIFGDQTIKHPDLVIPHPRMTERAFVMVPLVHLIPYRMFNGKTIENIAHTLQDNQKLEMCRNEYLE